MQPSGLLIGGALPIIDAAKPAQSPLLEMVCSSPLLINPDRLEEVRAGILHVALHPRAIDLMANPAMGEDEDFWPRADDWRASLRPYNVKNGVLQIPVMGVLLNRFSYQLGRFATGYAYIEKAVQRGWTDPNVRGIAFIHDSPGGEVAGNFELNDKIFSGRGKKPMRAFAADHSYSASYSLASAANNISVTRSGGVGSIGVVTLHVEYSKMLNDIGIKPTFIFAGRHKVDGNAYETLSKDAQSRMQDRIDKIYGVFTSSVARNRAMDEKAIRGTEALTYDAQDAIKIGLADRVGALEDEMVIFSSELIGDENMATDATDKGIPQAQHDAAIAAARAEGKAEGLKEGLTAGTARVKAILDSDAGKKRPKAALHAALASTMSADEAVAFIAGLAEEPAADAKPAGKRNHFDEAMGNGNPTVKAGDGGDEPTQSGSAEAAAKTILGDYKREGGRVRAAN